MVQVITNPWLRRWIDLECFVLSGMLAKDTIAAEMAFMFQERNKPGSTIDYPMGGSAALVDALVRGITKRGGRVLLEAPVEEVLMEQGRAAGVRLACTGGKSAGEVRCAAA
jgi:phytoene dehydrogenase-like protein